MPTFTSGERSRESSRWLSGNGGAIGSAFNQSEADPALTIEYPVQEADKVANTVGYLVVTVNETAGTMSAVQKVYTPETKTWRTGDQFTLSGTGEAIPGILLPKTTG